MTTKKTTTKKAAKGKAAPEELDAFAHHLAEVLRIARPADSVPASLYNDLANAWNEFVNTAGAGIAYRELHEGEAGVRLFLEITSRGEGAGQGHRGQTVNS
jgi:hypothetical protein